MFKNLWFFKIKNRVFCKRKIELPRTIVASKVPFPNWAFYVQCWKPKVPQQMTLTKCGVFFLLAGRWRFVATILMSSAHVLNLVSSSNNNIEGPINVTL